MKESEFVSILYKHLLSKSATWDVDISAGENLLYKVIVTQDSKDKTNLVYKPEKPQEPKRGNLAFQTDLLIKEKTGIPLVVIETKYAKEKITAGKKKIEGVSSHIIITYSYKASKHKEIYPYMRYGIILGNENKIPYKFFTHNVGFDFAIAIKKTILRESALKIIEDQILSARHLYKLLNRELTLTEYSNIVNFN